VGHRIVLLDRSVLASADVIWDFYGMSENSLSTDDEREFPLTSMSRPTAEDSLKCGHFLVIAEPRAPRPAGRAASR
jgi:hypothetical protein